ncbi:MAG: rubrerythrin family protein [Bacteroidetes bacterium]|nr:rubrerythrin family protein [Bacteroidota bacterium]
MSIKGSKTEKNLLKAFAGESQAKNRYQFFAKQAKKEGYEQIAAIFEETALQEASHAKIFFRYLEGGMVEITASYPAGIIATTAENLKAAAGGENEEWTKLYPEFSKIAEEEGFKKVAMSFKLIAIIEKEHEARFNKLWNNIDTENVFKRDTDVKWICRKCGHIHYGKKALLKCPVCEHPQAYYEIQADNY